MDLSKKGKSPFEGGSLRDWLVLGLGRWGMWVGVYVNRVGKEEMSYEKYGMVWMGVCCGVGGNRAKKDGRKEGRKEVMSMEGVVTASMLLQMN